MYDQFWSEDGSEPTTATALVRCGKRCGAAGGMQMTTGYSSEELLCERSGSRASMQFATDEARSSATPRNCPVFVGFFRFGRSEPGDGPQRVLHDCEMALRRLGGRVEKLSAAVDLLRI